MQNAADFASHAIFDEEVASPFTGMRNGRMMMKTVIAGHQRSQKKEKNFCVACLIRPFTLRECFPLLALWISPDSYPP